MYNRRIFYTSDRVTKLDLYRGNVPPDSYLLDGETAAEIAFYLRYSHTKLIRHHAPRLHAFRRHLTTGQFQMTVDRLHFQPTPFEGQAWDTEALTLLRKVVRQARALGVHDIGVVQDDAYNVNFAENLRNHVYTAYVYDFGRNNLTPREVLRPEWQEPGSSWRITEEGEVLSA